MAPPKKLAKFCTHRLTPPDHRRVGCWRGERRPVRYRSSCAACCACVMSSAA